MTGVCWSPSMCPQVLAPTGLCHPCFGLLCCSQCPYHGLLLMPPSSDPSGQLGHQSPWAASGHSPSNTAAWPCTGWAPAIKDCGYVTSILARCDPDLTCKTQSHDILPPPLAPDCRLHLGPQSTLARGPQCPF